MTMEEFDPKKNEAWDYGDEWAFGEEVEFVVPEITHNIWPHTNQGSRTKTKSACTIYGAVNQLIRLFGLFLTKDESNDLGEEVVDYCTEHHGYKPGYGWSTPDAINAVCKWRNEIGYKKFDKEKVFYTRRDYRDEKIKEALSKGHLIGFTFSLNFGEDRKKGLVWKDEYPGAGGHRTNWQSTKTTHPTGGASEPTADCGVYDSYYGGTNEYLIRDRSKYMNRGMCTPGYLILPQSNMTNQTVEEVKENIAETKAINYALGALTTAWANVPEKFQEKFAALAKEMREDFKNARPIEKDDTKKVGQTLADALSYCWKYMPEDIQKDMAALASKVRTNLNVK